MNADNPIVRVKQGLLQGVVSENVYGGKFLSFRGIPYAKPPVAQLRFKDPERAESWTGVRDASKFGDSCAHFDLIARAMVGSDDCLYLNVYTKSITGKRPVMLWIHGGGFAYGTGNDSLYGPDFLVRKNVVLVTINYRLGVLGFLNLEDEVAPGNQGLKDQIMALKWVQENISNFGGDVNNITIFGESAGGASVHYLTLSPLADGLFHKAISQSGVAINYWASVLTEPKKYGFQLAENLGMKTSDPKAVVEFLRTLDVQKLVTFQNKLPTDEENIHFLFPFGPGIDSKSPNPFLPEHPLVAMQRGVRVPYILGFCSQEGSFFAKTEQEFEKINDDFNVAIHPGFKDYLKHEDLTVSELRSHYFGDGPITKKASAQNYANFVTDVIFVSGIFDVLNTQLEKNRQPTYLYEFAYNAEVSHLRTLLNIELPGPAHAEDLSYLFYAYIMKRLHIRPPQPGTTEYKVIEYFTEMWTNFARTGNPTPEKTQLLPVTWKPVEKGDTYSYLKINNDLRMESMERGAQRFDWKRLKNKL